MKRREFITLFGGAAATWPVAARGQQAGPVRRIGVLMAQGTDDPVQQARVAMFRQQLQQLGWTDRNLQIDTRWSAGTVDNIRDGHVHGALRAGDDPGRAVLDRECQSHVVKGLHVLDASFMPTAGASNPSLTLIANAYRICQRVQKDVH